LERIGVFLVCFVSSWVVYCVFSFVFGLVFEFESRLSFGRYICFWKGGGAEPERPVVCVFSRSAGWGGVYVVLEARTTMAPTVSRNNGPEDRTAPGRAIRYAAMLYKAYHLIGA